jgi:hypothetical protein
MGPLGHRSGLTPFRNPAGGNLESMVGILVAAVFAALVFAACTALQLPAAVGIVFAVIALVISLPTLGARFGLRDF